MYLSLAIPNNKTWEGDVFVVPADPTKPRIQLTLEVPHHSTFRDVKQAAGDLTGYDPKKVTQRGQDKTRKDADRFTAILC